MSSSAAGSATGVQPSRHARLQTSKRRRRSLTVLGIVYALLGLEHTIVWVALPSLALVLDADWEGLSWLMDGYLLTFAGLVFFFGVLADRLGRRRSMLIGLTLFGAGAVMAALSEAVGALLFARVVMGMGAAACLPATFATIKVAFPEEEQPTAIAIWSGLGGVGIVLGPVTGGLLIKQFSWEAIFWFMVPVVLLLGAASVEFVQESKSPDRPRIDPIGSLLWVACLFALLWGTIELPRAGLSSEVIGALTAGALFGISFLTWQLLLAKRPVIDLRALINRTFIAAAGALFLGYFTLMGSLFPLAPYLQEVLAYEPWQAGLALLPVGFLLPAGAASVRLSARFGPKPLIAAGLGLIAAAMGLLSTVAVDTPYLRVGIALGLAGLGMGPVLAVGGHVILDCLPKDQAGVAAAIQQAVRLVGGAFGIGIVGAVVAQRYADGMQEAVRLLRPDQADAAREHVLAAVGIADAAGPAGFALRGAALTAYVNAMEPAMWVSVGAGVIGIVVTLVGLPSRGTTAGYVGADHLVSARQRRQREGRRLARRGSLKVSAGELRTLRVDGAGTLLVFVAGWRRDARFWRGLLEGLGERGQRAVALDLPGLGHPAGEGSLFDQCNEALGEALDQLVDPPDRVILVGHSMGGAAVAIYARERQDPRVAGVTLVAPPLKLSRRARRDLLRAAGVLALPPALSRRRLRRLAADWSLLPEVESRGRSAADSQGPSAADQAAEQLRLVRQFSRELRKRFDPKALTGEIQWVLLAKDRTALLEGVIMLPEAARVTVINAAHSTWGEEAVARLAGTLIGFASEVGAYQRGEPQRDGSESAIRT
jgi:EmrB/QacA subfamily drug resistance transporter